ncbi:transmembrane protein 265 [Rhinoderma darwinii]|uniref:transmembrane protein 265 n=1 Tax=Rhinoderma darwinii TaxID=43563 RepID=UPI003F66704F
MTEAQQLQVWPNSDDQKIQNGATEEEIQILVTAPAQPAKSPDCQPSRENYCGYFPCCSLRRLAIMSIVCGVSCVGIKALILALQAEQECDVEKQAAISRRSRKFSVLSIVLFVVALVSLPVLLVLTSFLITLIE